MPTNQGDVEAYLVDPRSGRFKAPCNTIHNELDQGSKSMRQAHATRNAIAGFAAMAALALACTADAAGGTAKGSLTYKAKGGAITIAPKFAYLVKGPDAVDNKVIRHLILSATDLEAKIAACKTMSCTDTDLGNGMTVDLDAGPRLNYWVVLNDQRVQYSGTAQPAVLTLTADTPARLAGKLLFDATAAGGPQVDIEFDAPLLKELKLAR